MLHTRVRNFRVEDYLAAAQVYQAACPEQACTADRLRFSDEQRESGRQFRRWVAEADGSIVGAVSYDQPGATHHTGSFKLDLAVQPTYQGKGIGTALYESVIAALMPLGPRSLLVRDVRAERVSAIAFLQRRGFREALRSCESCLDLAKFDVQRFATLKSPRDICIKTLREVASDAQTPSKLYTLLSETEADVPSALPRSRLDFEHFSRHMLLAPQVNPDSFFVAVSIPDEDYVGLSILWRSIDGNTVISGMTGTRRAYRRQGVALALKLAAIAWARSQGYLAIRTSNAVGNDPILALNHRLGFAPEAVAIDFTKAL